jgi:simple sugar transport system permease protein
VLGSWLPRRRAGRLGVTAPRFLTGANLGSIAFQLPELGLLTLAMLIPIISGGINLAIVYTANIAGLTLAWVLNANGGVDAGTGAFVLGSCSRSAWGSCRALSWAR